METESPLASPMSSPPRRHDLDALRAFAMLLGIALHAALSFIPGIWPVSDRYHNDGFGLAVSATHGFRMALFFLLSGYFTAMLWRRRGLHALIHHRVKRILLPLLLAGVTIIPVMNWCIARVTTSSISTSPSEAQDIWTAAATGNVEALNGFLGQGADPNGQQPGNPSGATPLILTAVFDQVEAARLLLNQGADANARGKDQGTPLHAAAFFGRYEVAALLIEQGADPEAKNANGLRAVDVLQSDWGTTEFIANLIHLPLEKGKVLDQRARIATLFDPSTEGITSPSRPSWKSRIPQLFFTPVFHHLWFLWYLTWLVAAFSLVAWIVTQTGWQRIPERFILSPLRMLWLLPITLIPQFMMGWQFPSMGPDTATGWLPWPPILLYYAVFFGFGALYQGTRDEENRLGGWWKILLPLALLGLFPVTMKWIHEPADASSRMTHKFIGDLLQVSYAWAMCFGLLGLFRRLAVLERPWIRFLSDASYWLYLAHLPLVILAQDAVKNWDLPTAAKFSIILVSVSTLLLVTYRYLVRYRALGTLLNGKRTRPTPTSA